MAKISVMIDPGHSPYDQNGGAAGYLEHNGMWKLANYLQQELTARGYKARLTRDYAETLSLWERGRRAAEAGANLFISLHSNASGNGKKRGVEAYYSVAVPSDLYLANALTAATAQVMGNPDLGGKTRPATGDPQSDFYTVIHSAQTGGVPHVILLENGFHDNAEDEAVLLQDEALRAMAAAQAQAIADYFPD